MSFQNSKSLVRNVMKLQEYILYVKKTRSTYTLFSFQLKCK